MNPTSGAASEKTVQATVLIVEDEAATRELLKTTIKGAAVPCRVFEAITSDQALEMAKQVKPDLVLLDIVLPGSETSGVLLCQELCKDHRTKVVIVSGQGEETIIKACLSAGATDRIRKPFSVLELRLAIDGWLSS